MKRSGPIKRRKRLDSNADTQKEWERRTRAAQIARQQEQGLRLPSRKRGKPTPKLTPGEPRPTGVPPSRVDGEPDTPTLAQMKADVKARSGGKCEANWPGVCPDGPHRAHHVHHIILRAQGGPDVAWNGLHLCAAVHTHAHDVDRAGAEARGIIRRWRPV